MFYSKKGLLFTGSDNRVSVNFENVYDNMQEWGKKSCNGTTEQVSCDSTRSHHQRDPQEHNLLWTHVLQCMHNFQEKQSSLEKCIWRPPVQSKTFLNNVCFLMSKCLWSCILQAKNILVAWIMHLGEWLDEGQTCSFFLDIWPSNRISSFLNALSLTD